VTAFGATTAVGYGDATSSSIVLLGREFGNKSYPLAAFGEAFDFSLRLTPDFGLRLFAGGAGYTGISAAGALVAGSTGSYDLRASLTAGHTWGAVRAALGLDVGQQPQFSILVGNAIISAVQTQTLGDNSALSSVESAYISPGVSVAAALHPSFGLIGEAHLIWTRLEAGTDSTDVREGYSLAALADFNIDPLVHFPMAITGITRLQTRYNDRGINRTLELGGGVFYTGRVPLQLGLEVVGRNGELRRNSNPSLTVSAAIATIVLRYYW
jgi:hypothetical protein